MVNILKAWYEKNFSDPQVVILAFLIVLGTIVVLYWGEILTPLLASLVIAYVLEGLVKRFTYLGMPRIISVITSFLIFIAGVLVLLIGLAPLVWKQVVQFFEQVPTFHSKAQQLILELPEQYPFLPDEQIQQMLSSFNAEVLDLGQKVLSLSLSSVVDIFTFFVYLVVVPLLVFFLLKDKKRILLWLGRFLPNDHDLSYEVWKDVDHKMGQYIRGKLIEILVVGVATYIPLAILGMNYAATLSLVVGLSVVIPYVGAIAVTIPVALIAWFQWGASSDFVYAVSIYLVIQMLDGNLLVPLLFGEVVNMHPVAIIAAVLVFGGLWGVWGVFFAIPLATLIQATINAWPRADNLQEESAV